MTKYNLFTSSRRSELSTVCVSVPATSANLGPGFDTLGLAVDLRNDLRIKPARFTSISIKGEGERNPKLRADNFFVNIFTEYFKELTGKKQHFRFSFFNKIPISRGLGSSSAVIVGAIGAAYECAKVPLPKDKLLNLALRYESHPDNITPAVMGGFNTALVNNAQVTSMKKTIPNSIKAVVVIPNKPISTHYSRTTLPKRYSRKDCIFNVSRTSMLTAAFFTENWEMLREASRDRMHQDYRMKIMPELLELQKLALQNGALMSTLSGSGSSFFNMTYADEADSLQKKLIDRFPQFNVTIFNFDNRGFYVK